MRITVQQWSHIPCFLLIALDVFINCQITSEAYRMIRCCLMHVSTSKCSICYTAQSVSIYSKFSLGYCTYSTAAVITVCRIIPFWKTCIHLIWYRCSLNEFIPVVFAKVSSDASMSAHPHAYRIHFGLIGSQEVSSFWNTKFATQTLSSLWTGPEFPHHLLLRWKLKNAQ